MLVSVTQLAQQLGCSVAAVRKWAAVLGFQKMAGVYLLDPQQVEQIKEKLQTRVGRPAGSATADKPWIALGISREAWYLRKNKGTPLDAPPSKGGRPPGPHGPYKTKKKLAAPRQRRAAKTPSSHPQKTGQASARRSGSGK